MGRAASTRTEVKMVLEDSDLRNKIKAQQREIKTQEKLLERLGREGKISFTKIEKGAGRATKSIRTAGQMQAKGFGDSAIGKLKSTAASYFGMGRRMRAFSAKDASRKSTDGLQPNHYRPDVGATAGPSAR